MAAQSIAQNDLYFTICKPFLQKISENFVRILGFKTGSKRPRNQQKFNITKQALENSGVMIDLLDLAALVSSTQADSDITGKGTGNQFCENKSTPFPFSSCLGKSFSKDQTASKIAKAYSNIQYR